MLPRNGGRAPLLICSYCGMPRRFAYGWQPDRFSGFLHRAKRIGWRVSQMRRATLLFRKRRAAPAKGVHVARKLPAPATVDPLPVHQPRGCHQVARRSPCLTPITVSVESAPLRACTTSGIPRVWYARDAPKRADTNNRAWARLLSTGALPCWYLLWQLNQRWCRLSGNIWPARIQHNYSLNP